MIRRAAMGLAVFLVLLAANPVPAHADAKDEAMEPIWLHYWEAIEAARQCDGRKFTGPDYDAMVHVINRKVDYAIGAGPRTHLITVAKDNVWDLVFKYGCKDPRTMDLLNLFHTDLEPVLPH